MGRLDWKRGRFNTDFETNEMNHGLRGWQNTQAGDQVLYYRFLRDASEMHDIYDEGAGAGRVYKDPIPLQVLHVAHQEGVNLDTDTGFYFNDDIYIRASYDQLMRTGLTDMDISTEGYLKDRIVYDGKVFKVGQVHVLGQIRQRDVIASIEGGQVKPDEMVNDPQFHAYSA